MNFARLVLQPRRFFEEPTRPVHRFWPLAGFYLFGFASFFQQFVAHRYRMPYWLVVFMVAWAPTLAWMTGLFVLLVLLWYWPASNLLGAPRGLVCSAESVGLALLPPGIFFSVSLLILATLKSNGLAAPYPLMVGAVQVVSGLWALALIVLAATVSHGFTRKKTAFFVLWFVVPVVLFAALVYAGD